MSKVKTRYLIPRRCGSAWTGGGLAVYGTTMNGSGLAKPLQRLDLEDCSQGRCMRPRWGLGSQLESSLFGDVVFNSAELVLVNTVYFSTGVVFGTGQERCPQA